MRCSIRSTPPRARRTATRRVRSMCSRQSPPALKTLRGTSEGQHVLSRPRAKTISRIAISILRSASSVAGAHFFDTFASSKAMSLEHERFPIFAGQPARAPDPVTLQSSSSTTNAICASPLIFVVLTMTSAGPSVGHRQRTPPPEAGRQTPQKMIGLRRARLSKSGCDSSCRRLTARRGRWALQLILAYSAPESWHFLPIRSPSIVPLRALREPACGATSMSEADGLFRWPLLRSRRTATASSDAPRTCRVGAF